MTISNCMKMVESLPQGQKTLWEKEKLLATSKKQGLFRKGLTHSHTMTPFDTPGKQAF